MKKNVFPRRFGFRSPTNWRILLGKTYRSIIPLRLFPIPVDPEQLPNRSSSFRPSVVWLPTRLVTSCLCLLSRTSAKGFRYLNTSPVPAVLGRVLQTVPLKLQNLATSPVV